MQFDIMLSSLRSYLSARVFAEATELQSSNELNTTSRNLDHEVENVHPSDSDDKFVVGFKEIMALARESSAKLADGLKNTAMQISEKITSSAPFVEFDQIQSDFLSAVNKEAPKIDTALSSPDFFLLVSSDGNFCDEKDRIRQQRVRELVLRLSLEEQNFLRPPPHGSCFQWNLDLAKQYTPIATALLQADPNLAALRFRLVPRRVKEDDFWRNYFYRVSLIRQSEGLPGGIIPSTSRTVAANESQDEPVTVAENEAGAKSVVRSPDQPAKVKTEGGSQNTENGSAAPEEGDAKHNLPSPVSSPVALSLSSDLSVDVIEAELMLEGSDLENSIAIDDNLEREILAELNDLGE
ncbi:Synapse-associated protein 1 [Taenia crassiceps]|uniref:Synapse-associated protein 1 n=1 Tax=Taenia crassiceps TaxID=6207 RepID=A0ABR4Q052_9CEST